MGLGPPRSAYTWRGVSAWNAPPAISYGTPLTAGEGRVDVVPVVAEEARLPEVGVLLHQLIGDLELRGFGRVDQPLEERHVEFVDRGVLPDHAARVAIVILPALHRRLEVDLLR